MYKAGIVLILFPLVAFGMEGKKKQLEICPARRAYIQNVRQQAQSVAIKQIAPVCPFCDPAILAKNYILYEDKDKDVREMMNLNPYLPVHRGKHLLVMPLSHVKYPIDLSREQLVAQADSVQKLSSGLYKNAYVQEVFANLLRPSGASVEDHWHTQLKSFEKLPASLPESLRIDENSLITTVEESFHATKECLALTENDCGAINVIEETEHQNNCLCCSICTDHDNQKRNLVFGETEFHILCLSHHPCLPGEVSVIPKRHVSSIKYLSQDEYRENMALSAVLLFKVKEYAQEYIRECGGANFYTKSIGGKASLKKQKKYHIHTVVIPRTIIVPTPGTLEGNSCKLDMEPLHFMGWLKDKMDEIKALIK